MQIVFAGQPELHAKLKLPEMRQVDQRVCGYQRLAPMSRDAVMGYIQHRLQTAGARRDRVLFPQDVVDALHRRSGGVPRLIDPCRPTRWRFSPRRSVRTRHLAP